MLTRGGFYPIKSKEKKMSTGTTVLLEPRSSDKTQPDTYSWRRLTSWVGTAVKALATHIAFLIRYDLNILKPLPINPALDIAVSNDRVPEQKTAEKVYRINDRGRVLKRSLRWDEYPVLSDGETLVPFLVVERLQNEAACMTYIRENTDIPVPKLLDTYKENGSYYLWMEFIDGVEMSELTGEEQSKVLPQVQEIIATLQRLRSSRSGGPTGLLSPPSIVYFYHLSEWEQRSSPEEEFVFCHGDLSQNNILVDPKTLKIAAIIDWEYGGFFPREHEIPFYESSETSGHQVKDNKYKPAVDKIIDFWRQSQKPASYESIPTSL